MAMDLVETPVLQKGLVGTVSFMDESALLDSPTVEFMVRGELEELWSMLNDGSCLVEGPPGSGKSTAVWLWLLRHVKQTGHRAVWAVDAPFENDFVSTHVDVCVVDGVTSSNLGKVANSWMVFSPISPKELKNCHMIWVSSQQVVVGQENFNQNEMKRYTHYTWTDEDIMAYAATFDAARQADFIRDVTSGVAEGRLLPQQQVTFELALEIKVYFFGNSARWLFGMSMAEALADLSRFVEAIEDVKILKAGLAGARSRRAVNHVIAMDRSHTRERTGVFKVASSFIVESLSSEIGLEAIRVMYASKWVKSNPAVHGFVFEWDILTRLEGKQQLQLEDTSGGMLKIMVDSVLRLAQFDASGMVGNRLLVCPEKWNHPEYDGMHITRGEDGLHMIAWNASEAAQHSGSVTKLLVQLEHWAQREQNPITFASVRFAFVVPTPNLHTFQLPSAGTCLAAKKQLHAWGFRNFEVFGTSASV